MIVLIGVVQTDVPTLHMALCGFVYVTQGQVLPQQGFESLASTTALVPKLEIAALTPCKRFMQ